MGQAVCGVIWHPYKDVMKKRGGWAGLSSSWLMAPRDYGWMRLMDWLGIWAQERDVCVICFRMLRLLDVSFDSVSLLRNACGFPHLVYNSLGIL